MCPDLSADTVFHDTYCLMVKSASFLFQSIPVWIIKYTLFQTKGRCGWWSNKDSHFPLGQIADLFGWQREILPSFKHMQPSASTDWPWLAGTLDTPMRLFESRLLCFGISKTEGNQSRRSVYNLPHEPPRKLNSDILLFGYFLLLAYYWALCPSMRCPLVADGYWPLETG